MPRKKKPRVGLPNLASPKTPPKMMAAQTAGGKTISKKQRRKKY